MAEGKRRKKRPAEQEKSGNWLTTYGDMVTLILTFFVLLYSFSTLDVIKFQKMIFSFRGAIGVIDGGRTFEEDKAVFSGRTMTDSGQSRKQTPDILKVAQKIQAIIRDEGLEKEVTVTVDQRGVVVSIAEGLLFATGQYELSRGGESILLILGMILEEIDNELSIEGHTDSVPLNRGGAVSDNWALSSLRAARIAAFFEGRTGISSRRIRAVGFGSTKPIMPNDSDRHRQMNRRADIVIVAGEGI
ncbi:MAG TPA: flagellar motor protein MotB [Synergistales bacterium]|nr:flagellar motor protein MotB [Synergistales bacterium]HRV71106.1 flagellar motor protein MotB [Thermovirgaceae bacterium]